MVIMVKGKPYDVYLAEQRLDTWLWLEIRKTDHQVPQESFGVKDVREILRNGTGEENLNWLINRLSDQRLLPVTFFDWIVNNERQIKWLVFYVKNEFSDRIISVPARLFGRDYIIASVDYLEMNLDEKAKLLERMHWQWEKHIKSDIIFKWFSGSDEKARCECAWEWLIDRFERKTRGYGAVDSYEDLLIFFDEKGGSDAEKMLNVNGIKSRWSQRKFRDGNTGKKQCNFWMSNKAVADLDKLAAKYGVKRPQIIEELIRSEIDEGKYLSERMRTITWE